MAITLDTSWTAVLDNASGNAFVQTGFHSTGTSPSIMIAALKLTTAAQPFINFTDNQGSTYTTLGPFGAASTFIYIGYALSPGGLTSYQVKANFTGTTGKSAIAAASFNGIATGSPFDKAASSTGSGTALDSTATTTTSVSNELLIGVGSLDGGGATTWTAGASFTKIQEITSNVDFCMEYQVVAATGTYNATLTSTASNTWQMAIATFADTNLVAQALPPLPWDKRAMGVVHVANEYGIPGVNT